MTKTAAFKEARYAGKELTIGLSLRITTGAGDTFMGTCLHYVLKYGIESLDAEKLMKMLDTANRAAAIITTRKGALRVMPSWEEIKNL